jgi:hypothetical protein
MALKLISNQPGRCEFIDDGEWHTLAEVREACPEAHAAWLTAGMLADGTYRFCVAYGELNAYHEQSWEAGLSFGSYCWNGAEWKTVI